MGNKGTGTSFRQVLSLPGVAALWLSEGQSTLGDQLARIAVTLLVYERTGSAAWSAAALAMTYLPDLIGTLGLSWLADRYPRRAVMIVAAVVQAVAFIAMAVPDEPPLWLLGVLVAAATIALAPYRAAAQALMYDLVVDADDRLAAQSLNSVTRTVGQIAGLAAGAAVIGAVGVQAALLANAVTFVITAVLAAVLVPRMRSARSARTRITRSAVVTLVKDRRLLSTTGLMCLAGVTAVPEGVVAPLAAQLHAAPSTVAWLLVAHPIGMALGIAFVRTGAAAAARRTGPLVWVSLVPLPMFAVLEVLPSVWVAVALLAVSGTGLAYHPVLQAAFTAAAPEDLRGTLVAIGRMALRLSQGLGVVLGGLAAQWMGSPSIAIVCAGLLGCGLAAWGLRGRRRAFQEAATPTV